MSGESLGRLSAAEIRRAYSEYLRAAYVSSGLDRDGFIRVWKAKPDPDGGATAVSRGLKFKLSRNPSTCAWEICDEISILNSAGGWIDSTYAELVEKVYEHEGEVLS